MDRTAAWGLRLRMVAILLALAVAVLALPIFAVAAGLLVTVQALTLLAAAVGAVVSLSAIPPELTVAAVVLGTAVGAVLILRDVWRLSVSGGRELLDGIETEPAGPALVRTVERLAQQVDCLPPAVRVTDDAVGGAMTVGTRPSSSTLVVSTAATDALSDRELRAVLAHELAHLTNRDAAVLTLASKPLVVERGEAEGVGSGSSWARAVSAVLVAWLSRTRELAADRGAVATTGDPAALASALETLSDGVATPGEDLRTSSHAAFGIVPPSDEREVGYDPSWPREPLFWSVRKPIRRVRAALKATHPRTADRIERLRRLSRSRER
ncbi:M48 family metallopeptidase [Haloarcula salina]|uniref:M48 family metalloprotease n=1 Tax=Haloarcula salina TaxID=1429914 RepID=A0AA41G0C0_9EURY|nr:M48 family metalloprotease [Haloarcula salina]MBV0901008.1 M48 family metalloprotease [Haloarcula salina]